ncbi:MAG TPA: hypothetical protein VGO67_26100 [Verrucomicrobiae bacterium]
MSKEQKSDKADRYPTTEWTVIINVLQKGDDSAAWSALEKFCTQYRPAIISFFLRRGCAIDRAEELTHNFFSSRIVEPWNLRHGLLSYSLAPEDIRDLPSFLERLSGSEPMPRLVQSVLPKLANEKISALSTAKIKETDELELRVYLATGLNQLIDGPSFYEEGRIGRESLSPETRDLLDPDHPLHKTFWVNRLLLRDAFPSNLPVFHSFLYAAVRREGRKFRCFLANVLWWFYNEELRKDYGVTAGGKASHVPLEDLTLPGAKGQPMTLEDFGREIDYLCAIEVIQRVASHSKYSKHLVAHLKGEISQREAAEALGIAEGAFRQQYHRFRRRLAEELAVEVRKLVGPDEKDIMAEISYFLSLLDR